jgi:hypothetical protein
MVTVGGRTYRVSKLYHGKYEVFRVLDDRRVGTFESTPRVEVAPEGIEPELLHKIALLALREGKLSWLSRA